MTSEKALNILFINTKGTENYGEVVEARNKIEKDLDRLEKLEKAIEILKKAFLLNVKEIHGVYYVLGFDTNYCMTNEEYELLKGVLENN